MRPPLSNLPLQVCLGHWHIEEITHDNVDICVGIVGGCVEMECTVMTLEC